MNRELEGLVALVTGAGNGIGRASALAFSREGRAWSCLTSLAVVAPAAIEYASKDIRVNAVCPGQRGLGQAAEAAEAATFLASPHASFITGHPLLVDGGFVSL